MTSQAARGSHQGRAEAGGDQDFGELWREDQHEPFAFDQRGKARDAERHEEKPDDGPALEGQFVRAAGSGADIQREADDEAQPDGSEPEPGIRIEVTDQYDQVPDEIAPEYQPAGRQSG